MLGELQADAGILEKDILTITILLMQDSNSKAMLPLN